MIKRIKLFSMISILLICFGGSLHAALFDYTLDIQLSAGYASLPNAEKIGGVEFKATGGSIGSNYIIGSAIPASAGWIFESFGGGNYGLYDNYDYANPAATYNPIITSGNILTISSDVQLVFSLLNFYDQNGNYFAADQYFTTAGFQETVVPIPSAILLLGGGLVSLVALRRRKS